MFLLVCGVCLCVCGPILSPEYGTHTNTNTVTIRKGNCFLRKLVKLSQETQSKVKPSNLVLHLHKAGETH